MQHILHNSSIKTTRPFYSKYLNRLRTGEADLRS